MESINVANAAARNRYPIRVQSIAAAKRKGALEMKLQFDLSKTYAVALEGGGAKGAYEIGVWKALEEAGFRYNAVSGTSVGALNGALMAMRDLPRAVDAWSNLHVSKVIDLGSLSAEDYKKLLNGKLDADDWQLLPHALGMILNGGLDVAPLRAWVRELVDAHRIKTSDVNFYVSTFSISDHKSLEVHVNELPEDQICDILLASAYHPSFRLEKLGGKFYADGGFVDTLPLHALVEAGYKDILAVRIPGPGVEKLFVMPGDVNVTTIRPTADLGNVLNFDAAQARRDIEIGCLDAKRLLYGLHGRLYYVDRSMSEREALAWILDHAGSAGGKLRDYLEKELPRIARQLDVSGADYYDLMLALVEQRAEKCNLPKLRIYNDRDLLKLIE